MIIIKRDGSKVEFDINKVVRALKGAFLEVDKFLYDDLCFDIAVDVQELIRSNPNKIYTVEEIQNFIEEELMASERKDVARAYIRYRYKKEVARNYSDDFIKAICEKLVAANVQNQNANVDEHSFGGRTGEATSVVTKQLALDLVMSELAKERHLNNQIYTHDLDNYFVGSHNCLTIPFDHLLDNGFNTRQTDIRPASSINTAFQLIAVIFQLQSLQQFGGVAASHLDWTMVPYVRKSFYKHFCDGLKYIDRSNEYVGTRFSKDLPIDAYQYTKHNGKAYDYALDMTQRELDQAVEGMYHNLK